MAQDYPASYIVQPLNGPISGTVTIPGSKSITNRALILAALASGNSILTGALASDDSRYMAESLNRLGIAVVHNANTNEIRVQGCGGIIPVANADLFIGNAGTAARFLTAFVALGIGTYRLDGVARMRQRPIGDLLASLQTQGVHAISDLGTGCPPVTITSSGLAGGRVPVRGDASSQFLSALLMVAPYAKADMPLRVDGPLVSIPYVEITLRMMEQWGITVRREIRGEYLIPHGQKYQSKSYAIEPDASSASYFFAAAAVTGGSVEVKGLGLKTIQGDIAFVDILEMMGCKVMTSETGLTVSGPGQLHGVDVDMNGISDTVMTLAAIAPFADTPTRIRNVAHIRHKETDRISATVCELRRLGVVVEEYEDGMNIQPCTSLLPATIETYDDHRMAMSFAITGLRHPGVTLLNPSCVSKTFPDFFETLEGLVEGERSQK